VKSDTNPIGEELHEPDRWRPTRTRPVKSETNPIGEDRHEPDQW